jgi:carbon monoxide dehydrogenase subunit G
MQSKFESRIGKVRQSAAVIYNWLSDFRNFTGLVPADKVKNWQATADECHFTVDMVGDTGLKIAEKEEAKLIKITTIGDNPYNFFFWIQLKEVAPYDTRIKLTLKLDLNPMLRMMAAKPIQNFLDSLIDQMEKMSY